MKSNINKYFNEKERKKIDEANREAGGLPQMTAADVRLTCLEHDGYESPELNEKLYLHFRGFRKIENLEQYVNCKALWLESNGFEKLEGLDTMLELRCLYLSKNLLPRIEGLACLANLTIIDLSHNRLTKLENLACCPNLQTLNVSRNSFTTGDAMCHLIDCPRMENVDLSHCNIPAEEDIFNVITRVGSLMNLAITGNELTKLQSFRKRLIVALPRLHYLDRPIEELERLRSEAFVAAGGVAGSGPEAEKACMDQYKADQQQARVDEMAVFRAWQTEHRAKMQAERAAKVAARDAAVAAGEPIPPELEDVVRSSVSELTPEEQEDYRRAEIQRAQDAEKEMLDLGVDRIAAKYWEIEAQDKRKSVEQLMKESVAAVKLDDERQKEERALYNDVADDVQKPDETSSSVEEEEKVVVPDALSADDAPAPSSPAKPAKSAAEVELEHQLEQYHFPVDGDADGDADGDEEEEEVGDNEVDTPAMQALRQQRVDESLFIFNKQRELKQLQAKGGKTAGAEKVSSTWDESAPSGTAGSLGAASLPDVTPDTLYWTEAMDMELAAQVKTSFFDFSLVSTQLMALQRRGKFSEQLDRYCPTDAHSVSGDIKVVEAQSAVLGGLLGADACRLRWAELDANRWSVPVDGITSGSASLPLGGAGAGIDTGAVSHRVFVRPSDITGAGHGNQPSFDQLAQQASASAGGSYLKKPMSFPSVRATGTAEGDEDEDEDLEALD